MLHLLKIHAKQIVKAIAQITNVVAVAVGGLQASGVLTLLDAKLNVEITLGIILLNMLAHYLKPYEEPTTALPTAAVSTAPPVVAAPANANSSATPSA
jgi:hypothetical protein